MFSRAAHAVAFVRPHDCVHVYPGTDPSRVRVVGYDHVGQPCIESQIQRQYWTRELEAAFLACVRGRSSAARGLALVTD